MSTESDTDSSFDWGTGASDPESTLSANKAVDVVEYIRGSTIKNEAQGLLLLLGWLTCRFKHEERYVNTVVCGTSSSGKTHLVRQMKELLPDDWVYEATDTSDKGFVDDRRWNEREVAVLSEWQKLDKGVREYIKSVSGGDGGYRYTRSKGGSDDAHEEGAAGANEIHKKPMPYSFTYAQHSMDNETFNRLLKNHVDEGVKINRAVARMHHGHEHITMDGAFEEEYIFDVSDLEVALRRHIRSIPPNAHVYMPPWVFYAVEPIYDIQVSESKRVSKMVADLIRASTLLNYDTRETTTIDDDGVAVEAYIVEPQDVANVLSARKVLLGTTHELEERKLKIVDALRTKARQSGDGICVLEDIHEYFQDAQSDMSQVGKDELRTLLRQLDEKFIVREHERYDGSAHGYEYLSLSRVGHPRLTGLDEFSYESENPFLGCGSPQRPFGDCIDPITGEDFHESVERFRADIEDSVTQSMDAGSAMGGAESPSEDAEAQTQLTESQTPEPDGPIEQAVYERHEAVAGETFPTEVDGTTLEHEHVMDIVEPGTPVAEASFAGTIQSPDHDLWEQPDRQDDWVTSEGQARSRVEQALKSLMQKGLVTYAQRGEDTIRVEVK